MKIFVYGERYFERDKKIASLAPEYMASSKGEVTLNAAQAYRGNFLLFVTVRLFLLLLFLSSSTEGGYDDHYYFSPAEGDHDYHHHYVPGWDAA